MKGLTMLEDKKNLRGFARKMRREPTPAEASLWVLIRNRRLTGFKFRRQHPFGRYILDCYCPNARLVVELDGDSHATPEAEQYDEERQRYLVARGILVLRFWNTELAENPEGIIERIADMCAVRAKRQRVVTGEGK